MLVPRLHPGRAGRRLCLRAASGREIEQRVIFRHVAGPPRGPTSPLKMKTNQRNDAIDGLRKNLKTDMTVYTVLRSTSPSGMSRTLDLYYVSNGEILRITWSAALALGWTYDRKREALRINGAGMDMGFHAVYSLSAVLFQRGDALNHRWL